MQKGVKSGKFSNLNRRFAFEIDVYQKKENACRELLNYTIPKIYLIPIFVEYNSKSELNYQDLIDVCNIDSYSQHIYSYQLDLPQEQSFNPMESADDIISRLEEIL